MVLDMPKHFLFEEINQILFEAELKSYGFFKAIKYFGVIKAQEQDSKIAPTYYPKRKPENSSLDPNDTIANQFDIIRLEPESLSSFSYCMVKIQNYYMNNYIDE